ncbi:endonuclease/exonuclease/phosphatase family protein (plasmid) [Sinorhizobium meliloti]|nr:endonuclease/exonuclease/phosphatase family protein [Sinorhizobium meliloti]WKL24506.1 endonuclease/exonuclease/phosphatase family protein [Sinorhizobium meliloti]
MRLIICLATMWLMASSAMAQPITIVSYNAENLFDTEDDLSNPRDDTYLPLTIKDQNRQAHDARCEQFNGSTGFYVNECKTLNWDGATYSTKLKRYADVMLAMPSLPDIVVIPETENKKVLDDLVAQHLGSAGYTAVQLDTSDEPDSRGIDVGMLTKLPLVGTPQAHVVDFGGAAATCGKTRDILQVTVKLPDGENLTVFGVHFPSGASPFECRVRALKQVSSLSAALPAGSLAIAVGDFNVNCGESQTEGFSRLLQRGNWYVSPLATHGCNAPGSTKFVDRVMDNWNTWSFLDMILVSPELSATRPSEKNWFADLGSFGTVVVHPEQITVDEDDKGFVEPRRFDPKTGRGVSDHWPVMMRLLPRRS